jgi:hypothetical protein
MVGISCTDFFPLFLSSTCYELQKLENGVVESTLQNGDFDKPEYQLDP